MLIEQRLQALQNKNNIQFKTQIQNKMDFF